MNSVKIKRSIDIVMTLVLFFLMAYQVTGETLHEWLGITMTALVIFHNILNRRRYRAHGKGRYNAYRITLTANDIALLLCFFGTALCGISMSSHAVPFLSGFLPSSFARTAHLALSHWSFALMGIGNSILMILKIFLKILFFLENFFGHLFILGGLNSWLMERFVFDFVRLMLN